MKMPYICLLQNGVSSLPTHIEKATKNHYSAVAIAINANISPNEPTETSPTYPDTIVDSENWNSKVLLMLSDNVDCDSPNEKYREYSQRMMLRDKNWADHLQFSGYKMVRLRKADNPCLRTLLMPNIKGILAVRVPIINPNIAEFEHDRDRSEEDMFAVQNEDTWEWWHKFHAGCNFHSKVKVVIEIIEGARPSKEEIRRWLGEPIEAIIIPSSMFIRNRHNYSVLPKDWQMIIKQFIGMRANIIISTRANDSGLNQYADYMENMLTDASDNHNLITYEDMLETPLQPLLHNLDCYTYEIFEKDPVKYKLYQEAVQQALLDRVAEEEKDSKPTIVMLLGAGRGPLARAIFNAADVTKRKVQLYIIEKNPNAIRTIWNMVKEMWHERDVHIFSEDMRKVAPPELADILVSELLGSFGDNELSPECLDGALKLLKPDGISIPCKSTSYINPIMSTKLFNNIREHHDHSFKPAYDSGYVVMLKNIYNIDAPKALFEFNHPNRAKVINNNRYKKLSFKAASNCVLHGIGGYFDAVLYKDVVISIVPSTHTPGMYSWFPMFFPLKPVPIRKYQEIEIHLWRKVECNSVWYEWCIQKPFASHNHNEEGVGYKILL